MLEAAPARDPWGRLANLRRHLSVIRLQPYDMESPENRALERQRRLALTGITGLLSRGMSMVTGLISVPLTIQYLGTERYGLWMTITGFVLMLSFTDLGLGNGLMNAVSTADGAGDRATARVAVASAFAILGAVALALGTAFAASFAFVSWPAVFNVASAQAQQEAAPAAAVVVGCFIAGLPLGMVPRIQGGLQLGFVTNLWSLSGNILALLALVVAVRARAGLPVLLLAFVATPLVATVANGLTLFRSEHAWLRPRLGDVSRAQAWQLLRIGLQFMTMQVCVALAYSSDNVIIARLLGAGSVADYAVARRLFDAPMVLLGIVTAPLWPAFSEAAARGDVAWVRRTFTRSFLGAMAYAICTSLVLVAAGPWLIRLWARGAVTPSGELLVGMGAWNLCLGAGTMISVLLNALNDLRIMVLTSVAMVIVGTTVRISFCKLLGLSGMPWGTTLSYVAVVLVPVAFAVRRQLALLAAGTRAGAPS